MSFRISAPSTVFWVCLVSTRKRARLSFSFLFSFNNSISLYYRHVAIHSQQKFFLCASFKVSPLQCARVLLCVCLIGAAQQPLQGSTQFLRFFILAYTLLKLLERFVLTPVCTFAQRRCTFSTKHGLLVFALS